MFEQKARIDKLTTKMSFIKDLIFRHDCGEIYITWKGGKMTVKFSQLFHLASEDSDLTNTNGQK